MEAHLTITGYVGTEVEYRITKAGWAIASFRLACTPRRRTETGWVDRETVWISVRCTRSLADNVKASVDKGDPVIVQGHLRRETWVDSEDVRHERLLLEAATVAHDLTRGTAAFRRTQRAVVDDPETEVSVVSPPQEAPDWQPVELAEVASAETAEEVEVTSDVAPTGRGRRVDRAAA